MKKWYLQTWFICLFFVFWSAIFPVIIGLILLFLQYQELKKQQEDYAMIDDAKAECEKMINDATEKAAKVKTEIATLEAEKLELQNEIKTLRDETIVEAATIYIDDKITSEEYKDKLSMLRIKQNEFIKSDKALKITSSHSKKVTNNNAKQILRCFNSEASVITSSVTASNIDAMRNKLQKVYETLNKIYETDGAISHELFRNEI